MPVPLLDLILDLLNNEDARNAFEDDPEAVLKNAGHEDLCGADVDDARTLVLDNHHVSFKGSDREYNHGNTAVVSTPPPPPPAHPGPGETEIEAAIRNINYITKNYVYQDDHSSTVDNSVNQDIYNRGFLLQTFDNDPTVAHGDGAVAVGDDLEDSTVNTGDRAVTAGDDVEGANTGDRGVAAGEEVEGAATGDRAVAAGDDIEAPVNTGHNNGIVGDDNDGNVAGSEFGKGAEVATTGGEIDHSSEVKDSYNKTDSHDETETTTISNSFNEDNDTTTTESDDDVIIKDNDVDVRHSDDDVIDLKGALVIP
jgi:hypothetical protein